MKIIVFIYSICKRWKAAHIVATLEYVVEKYEIIKYSDEEARELGFTDFDDDGEYLTLYLESGEVIRYCNTRVDLCELG